MQHATLVGKTKCRENIINKTYKKLNKNMKKTLIRTLVCIAGAAIIAALGRACNNDHTIMPNKPSYPMQVYSTELLTIYDITDCPLDLACGQMPDTAQENILLCAAAAFTGKCLNHFEHSNILGPYISGGMLYEGYTEDKDGIPPEIYGPKILLCSK